MLVDVDDPDDASNDHGKGDKNPEQSGQGGKGAEKVSESMSGESVAESFDLLFGSCFGGSSHFEGLKATGDDKFFVCHAKVI